MRRCCLLFKRTRSTPRNWTRFAAQYLARGLPCERFTSALTGRRASLGVGAVGYSLPREGLAPPILCQLVLAHSQMGQSRPTPSAPTPPDVRYSPESGSKIRVFVSAAMHPCGLNRGQCCSWILAQIGSEHLSASITRGATRYGAKRRSGTQDQCASRFLRWVPGLVPIRFTRPGHEAACAASRQPR